MSTVYVQFADNSEKTVGTVFSSPQDQNVHSNYAEIDSEDDRYKAFWTFATKPLGE